MDKPLADNPVAGAAYALRGLRLITQRGLRGYVIGPLAVNVVLFGAAIAWAWTRLGALGEWLRGWLPGWLEFLSVLLVPLFAAAALLVVFFTFSLLANLIAAPLNGLLAEAVERQLRGASGGGDAGGGLGLQALVREAGRSIRSELRKLAYFAPRALGLLVLSFVPLLNVAAPFAWLLFSAWMLAIAFVDYPMGNHGYGFSEQRARLRRIRLTSLGFGATVMAGFLVPLLNLVVMPAAVAGATLLWFERIATRPDAG